MTHHQNRHATFYIIKLQISYNNSVLHISALDIWYNTVSFDAFVFNIYVKFDSMRFHLKTNWQCEE